MPLLRAYVRNFHNTRTQLAVFRNSSHVNNEPNGVFSTTLSALVTLLGIGTTIPSHKLCILERFFNCESILKNPLNGKHHNVYIEGARAFSCFLVLVKSFDGNVYSHKP
jgi:hypothetical protein